MLSVIKHRSHGLFGIGSGLVGKVRTVREGSSLSLAYNFEDLGHPGVGGVRFTVSRE